MASDPAVASTQTSEAAPTSRQQVPAAPSTGAAPFPRTGVVTAVVTPMMDSPAGAEAAVDIAALRTLIRRQIAAGVSGVLVLGTTGENPTLTDSERHDVISAAVAECANTAVAVIAGCGTNCTRTTIERTAEARALGAAGALVVTPYYNKPTQSGLLAHFRAVAAAVDSFPICVYNVPGRTASHALPETVACLARDFPNICAVKQAADDFAFYPQLRRLCPPDFVLFAGNDADVARAAADPEVAADGVMSVASNVFPEAIVEFEKTCRKNRGGEEADAVAPQAALEAALAPLLDVLFVETNPAPVKFIMSLQGFSAVALRLPLVPLSNGMHEKVRTGFAKTRGALEQLGLDAVLEPAERRKTGPRSALPARISFTAQQEKE